MERLRQTKTARLRALRMYREDLDHLMECFQKTCEKTTISDNVNSYVSLDDMKATLGSTVTNLDIRGERPSVHFLLNQKEYPPGSTTPAIFNELRTEEITEEAENLFREIKEFLESYQRPTPTRFLVPAILGLVGAFLSTGYAVMSALAMGQKPTLHGTVLLCLVVSIAVALASTAFGIANSQNRLSLEKKLDAPSFFVKNREDFATHAVRTVIACIITLLIGYLLGHYLK
jgi:hypothetical protein